MNHKPKPNDWMWDNSQWSDQPTAPTAPDQIPDTDDGWPGWLRRLLRWSDTRM